MRPRRTLVARDGTGHAPRHLAIFSRQSVEHLEQSSVMMRLHAMDFCEFSFSTFLCQFEPFSHTVQH